MVWHHAASTGIALVSAPQVHNFISFFFSHSLSFYFILTSILKLSFLVTYLMTIALFSAVIICCITVAQGWCLPVTLTVYTKTKTDPSHIPSLLPVTYCVLCFFYTSVLWFSHLFNLVIHNNKFMFILFIFVINFILWFISFWWTDVCTDIDEDYDPMAGYEPAGLSHQSGKHVIFYLISFKKCASHYLFQRSYVTMICM